ncbi:MAG TPA: flagellar filament capping protein FliD [Solirubrobacteraceae bacterium]|nr:flagellar filament capping protein FliD [Solirubrobacteraceae bacterium]
MSTQSVGPVGVPINITGLGSGLDTNSIISALMGAARLPVTHLTNVQTTIQAQQTQLQNIKSSLQQLAFSASDLASPSLFKTAQGVTSSDPTRVSATSTTGAGIGGYQVNVTQLANSAHRGFTFTSPTADDVLTIDGHQTTVLAGATIQDFVQNINSDADATVYAAALDDGTVVLSDRTTGDGGAGFIQVADSGGMLTEQAALAKQGQNAAYSIDGVAATSTSNTVTNGIAGVTLSLNALTPSGPVTVNVAPPAASVSAIQAQVQSFITLYNSTIGSIQQQLSTKPVATPHTNGDLGTGTLYGDSNLTGLLNSMRRTIYTPDASLPTGMASLADIGVSTGAATSGASTSSSLAGNLKLDADALASAIQTNPAGVQKMLQSWSQSFQSIVHVDSQAGGTLDTRINGNNVQLSHLSDQISTMNEMLDRRQVALQAQFAQLEGILSANQTQSSWLASQSFGLTSNKN